MSEEKREKDDLPDLPDSVEIIPAAEQDELPDLPMDVEPSVRAPKPPAAPRPLPLKAPAAPAAPAAIEELETLDEPEPIDPGDPIRRGAQAKRSAPKPKAPPRPAKPEPRMPESAPAPPAPRDDIPLAPLSLAPELAPGELPPLRELDSAPAHLRTAAMLVVLGSLMPYLQAEGFEEEGSVWFSLAGKGVMLIAAWLWCQQVLHNFGPAKSGIIGKLASLSLIPSKPVDPEEQQRKARKSSAPQKQKHPFPTGLHLLSLLFVVGAIVLSLRDPRTSKVGPLGPAEVGVLGWAAFTYVHIVAYRRWGSFNPLFPLMFLAMLLTGIASLMAGMGAEGVWKIFSMAGGVIVGGGGGLAAYTIVEAMMEAKKDGDRKKAEAIEARKAARKTKG